MTVLVIGGGITGLTAAYALGRAGIPVTLVEAGDRLGGKVHTEQIDGFLVEAGPDSFISYRPAAVELARELGLADAIIAPTEPRTVHIRARGRFGRLPDGMGLALPTRMRPFLTSDLFSPWEKLRMGLDLMLPRDGLGSDVAVGTFLRRRLGGALVERLAGPLIGGVYGTPIDQLSLLAVVPQLREAELRHRSLLLASLASGRARRGAPSASPFVTLAGGTGQLTAALVASLERADLVGLRTGSAAVNLERHGARFEVRLASGEVLQPEAVVLAVPAPATAGLLDGLAPGAAAHLRSIPYGSSAVVSLAYRLDQFRVPPAGHGFLVAQGEPLAIDACTLSSLKWPGRAPEGTILLRCFLGSRNPSIVAATNEQILASVEADLGATMGVRGTPILTRVARLTGEMPRYTVGHLDRVAAALAELGGTPGLVLAGAAYRGVGLPDCIAQGRAAASQVAAVLAGSPTSVVPGASPPGRVPTGAPGCVTNVGGGRPVHDGAVIRSGSRWRSPAESS